MTWKMIKNQVWISKKEMQEFSVFAIQHEKNCLFQTGGSLVTCMDMTDEITFCTWNESIWAYLWDYCEDGWVQHYLNVYYGENRPLNEFYGIMKDIRQAILSNDVEMVGILMDQARMKQFEFRAITHYLANWK